MTWVGDSGFDGAGRHEACQPGSGSSLFGATCDDSETLLVAGGSNSSGAAAHCGGWGGEGSAAVAVRWGAVGGRRPGWRGVAACRSGDTPAHPLPVRQVDWS